LRNHVFIARLSIISFVHQNFQMRRIKSWLQTIEYRLHNYCLNALPDAVPINPASTITHTVVKISKINLIIKWQNHYWKCTIWTHSSTFCPNRIEFAKIKLRPFFEFSKWVYTVDGRRTRNTQVENQMPSCLIVYIKIFDIFFESIKIQQHYLQKQTTAQSIFLAQFKTIISLKRLRFLIFYT
jgi:hypothetical protein